MRTFVVGECLDENKFELWDPDASTETEFEIVVARALSCAYPNHTCIMFAGGFRYDDRIYRPDMALIADDGSHWFVIEVELIVHSLEGHVLPQVRAFQYGEWQGDCIGSLARSKIISREQAETLLHFVPRTVAVIANKWSAEWQAALSALQVQLLAISVFRSSSGIEAVEMNGRLEGFSENLGWGTYSAVDRCFVFPKEFRLPDGVVQINDPGGSIGTWIVKRDSSLVWVTKEFGRPDFADKAYVQLIRTASGSFSFRRPNPKPRITTI